MSNTFNYETATADELVQRCAFEIEQIPGYRYSRDVLAAVIHSGIPGAPLTGGQVERCFNALQIGTAFMDGSVNGTSIKVVYGHDEANGVDANGNVLMSKPMTQEGRIRALCVHAKTVARKAVTWRL